MVLVFSYRLQETKNPYLYYCNEELAASDTTGQNERNLVSQRIHDIRQETMAMEGVGVLKREPLAGLQPRPRRQKKMPSLLLYDEVGQELYKWVTHSEQYYLMEAEIDVLQRNAEKTIANFEPGSLFIKLGSV